MLALTRRPGEFIRITVPPSTQPQTIAIGVLHCGRMSTKLGVTAPRDIEVLRTELTAIEPPPVAEAATAI